jgi:hypothetical protein
MRTAFVILSFLAMLVSGFWAYRENYATKAAIAQADALADDIARLTESIAVQRAEWAHLNRPDRLSELAAANFDRLGLMPMQPEQFADTNQLPAPVTAGMLEDVTAVTTLSAEDEEMLP